MAPQQIEGATQRTEHAQRQYIHLEHADRVQVILVPLDYRALGHAGILDRHQSIERRVRYDKTARMLRQVPREADQLARQRQHPVQPGIVHIKPGLGQPLGAGQLLAPAAAATAKLIDLLLRQTHCPRYITYCARRQITGNHSGQCRPLTTVTAEDVLNDLFAPLVLKIHIDIRRLIALAGDKALEQQIAPIRVDLGNPQRKTHRRIGGRAAALTENLLLAGEGNDVLHGEKVAVVGLLRDQLQFILQLRTHLVADPVWPTPGRTAPGQFTQPAGRGMPLRHQLARILVAQLTHVELTACGNTAAFGQQRRRVDRGQRR